MSSRDYIEYSRLLQGGGEYQRVSAGSMLDQLMDSSSFSSRGGSSTNYLVGSSVSSSSSSPPPLTAASFPMFYSQDVAGSQLGYAEQDFPFSSWMDSNPFPPSSSGSG